MTDWDRCSPYLEAALEYDGGFYALSDVAAIVAAGQAHFWPGKRSAVITQFWMFPRAKALNFWLAGGNMGELIDDMRPCIEAWAAAQGCTDLIIAGRKGWGRVLEPYGYAPVWTAFRKHLTDVAVTPARPNSVQSIH